MGEKTREAIIAYQKAHPHLEADGILGPATLSLLRRDAKALRDAVTKGAGSAVGSGALAFMAGLPWGWIALGWPRSPSATWLTAIETLSPAAGIAGAARRLRSNGEAHQRLCLLRASLRNLASDRLNFEMLCVTCSMMSKCFSFSNSMTLPHLLQESSSFAFTQSTVLLISWPHSGQGMSISSLNMACTQVECV